MTNVCAITGGGSGLSLAAAKLLGKDYHVILSGRTKSKLEKAQRELSALGIEANIFQGDVADRERMAEFAHYASQKGPVTAVIHSAGVSPQMTDGISMFNINAMGTINVNCEFIEVMNDGGCILDVSSMSAYMMPVDQIPTNLYPLANEDPAKFKAAFDEILGNLDAAKAAASGYVFSKHFVQWYVQNRASSYGQNGVRVVSVSPGSFDTDMGQIESGSAAPLAKMSALGRYGRPDEMAELMKFLISDKASYITGVDILCDGGTIAAMRNRS